MSEVFSLIENLQVDWQQRLSAAAAYLESKSSSQNDAHGQESTSADFERLWQWLIGLAIRRFMRSFSLGWPLSDIILCVLAPNLLKSANVKPFGSLSAAYSSSHRHPLPSHALSSRSSSASNITQSSSLSLTHVQLDHVLLKSLSSLSADAPFDVMTKTSAMLFFRLSPTKEEVQQLLAVFAKEGLGFAALPSCASLVTSLVILLKDVTSQFSGTKKAYAAYCSKQVLPMITIWHMASTPALSTALFDLMSTFLLHPEHMPFYAASVDSVSAGAGKRDAAAAKLAYPKALFAALQAPVKKDAESLTSLAIFAWCGVWFERFCDAYVLIAQDLYMVGFDVFAALLNILGWQLPLKDGAVMRSEQWESLHVLLDVLFSKSAYNEGLDQMKGGHATLLLERLGQGLLSAAACEPPHVQWKAVARLLQGSYTVLQSHLEMACARALRCLPGSRVFFNALFQTYARLRQLDVPVLCLLQACTGKDAPSCTEEWQCCEDELAAAVQLHLPSGQGNTIVKSLLSMQEDKDGEAVSLSLGEAFFRVCTAILCNNRLSRLSMKETAELATVLEQKLATTSLSLPVVSARLKRCSLLVTREFEGKLAKLDLSTTNEILLFAAAPVLATEGDSSTSQDFSRFVLHFVKETKVHTQREWEELLQLLRLHASALDSKVLAKVSKKLVLALNSDTGLMSLLEYDALLENEALCVKMLFDALVVQKDKFGLSSVVKQSRELELSEALELMVSLFSRHPPFLILSFSDFTFFFHLVYFQCFMMLIGEPLNFARCLS